MDSLVTTKFLEIKGLVNCLRYRVPLKEKNKIILKTALLFEFHEERNFFS